MIKYKKFQTAGTAGSLLTLTNPKKINQYNKELAIKNGTYIPSPTLANDNWKYKNSEVRKSNYVQSKAKPNNVASQDNTKLNYQQAPIVYKTYSQNVNDKTVNVPINPGTITQDKKEADNLYNNYFRGNKTLSNIENNLMIPMFNITGGLEGANLIKQGVKSIIKKIPKKVPLKVNNISNEIRLYNKNFNNNPTDNYKAIIDKGTSPIISKDIPDEPYERIFHRNYTHGNPDDTHRFILKNKPLKGKGNNVIQKNDIAGIPDSDQHGGWGFLIDTESNSPNLLKIKKRFYKPDWVNKYRYNPHKAYQKPEMNKQWKPNPKTPNLNTQKSEMSFNLENMINHNNLSKIYRDLERRNIDISNINRIKYNLDKFDDIE